MVAYNVRSTIPANRIPLSFYFVSSLAKKLKNLQCSQMNNRWFDTPKYSVSLYVTGSVVYAHIL